MRHQMVRGVVAALFLAASAAAAPPDAPTPGPKAGSITALLPVASIVRGPAKQQVATAAKKGDDVVWNDLVRTDKGGRARITLLDQSILSVGSQAELRIVKSDPKSQQTSLEVNYGRVRMEVTPITQPGGSFEVKTPTAVAGVIGTTFGVDSSIGSTTVYCVTGNTWVSSNAPNLSGQVPCPPGTVAVVAAGKAPVTRPATQQEIQQFTQDTEPAVISAINPNLLPPGATADASITGTQLGNINAVSSSSPSVTATLNAGGTATSLSVHLVVAANAAPGPVTLTLSSPSGVPSAAVLTIAGTAGAAGLPSLTLSPSTLVATEGGQVTITGANFDCSSTQVTFGGTAQSVTSCSSTQLTVTVPPGNPGPVAIAVVTGGQTFKLPSSSFSFSQPTYLDPGNCTTLLAQAFSSLQTGSATGSGCGSGGPATVLGFFSPNFPGLTTLQQALQIAFQAYSSMQVHLVGAQVSTSGNLSIVTANWQLLYTIKNDPACKNTTPCQPPTYQSSLGTVTTVWTLTPGAGWSVTDFRYQNGFTQGTLPAVPVPTNSSPDLEMEGVVAQGIPGNPIPIGVGAQTFVATVKNIGSATSGQTTVHFVLKQLDGTLLGSTSPDPVLAPLGPGAIGTATGTITVPNLTAVTQAQLVATANPGCTVPETTCNNDSGTFAVVITPPSVPLPNLVTQITNVTSGATLGTGPQTIQATVSNVGTAPFAASPPVNFSVAVAGNTVASAQVTITGPIAVNQVVPVQATLTIPITIAAGTPATLTVDASPTCPNPVETVCTDNTASLPIFIGVPTAIIVTSSAANTINSSPLELNGPLTTPLTLTATRSDNITTGSVTLTFTGSQVTSTPPQLTSIPYAAPEAVNFTAAIDASGNVTTGPASVTVTPSNATPFAGPQPSTLFFNTGDINLSSTPSCLLLTGGVSPAFTFTIDAVSGFDAPSVAWQWSGFPAGVSVNQASGAANLTGATYTLPNFTFTSSITGSQTLDFDVTISNSQGSATKVFALNINLSTTACPAIAGHVATGHAVTGTWTRGGFGGGMARAVPQPTGPLPDLQLNATSVTFTPSIPKPGDTVEVRFRVTNAGNADAQQMPIALVVHGVAVVTESFDVRAGASTLAALEWTNASVSSGSRAVPAAVVVDPNHTATQKSTLAKSAPLAHFAFLPASGAQAGTQVAATTQRTTLEVADGGCVGFRFASGAGAACGSADVEITAEQLASGHFTLSAQNGIADLGSAFGGGTPAAVQYQQDAQAVAGHSYAVRLGGGQTGILRLVAIRNPAQTSAKGRQVFGAGNLARNVGGATTGPIETGDVSGVRSSSQPKAYFDVSYQTQ